MGFSQLSTAGERELIGTKRENMSHALTCK